MTVEKIKSLFREKEKDLAFVIGNGINIYRKSPKVRSWSDLLLDIWKNVSPHDLDCIPKGISFTEFYDILDLENRRHRNIQKELCAMLEEWNPKQHHRAILNRMKSMDAPVLTTNFDEALARAVGLTPFRIRSQPFTDYYPWSNYHSWKKLKNPLDGFAVWYINGMIRYHRSIKLGLTQYMGSVERARRFLHQGDERNLFFRKSASDWEGAGTWLQIVFNKSLFIFGLRLAETETFLRWLLIERSRFFRKFPEQRREGWYMEKKKEDGDAEGKRFFLERVGIQYIELDSYEEIYEGIWKI